MFRARVEKHTAMRCAYCALLLNTHSEKVRSSVLIFIFEMGLIRNGNPPSEYLFCGFDGGRLMLFQSKYSRQGLEIPRYSHI